VPNHRGHNGVDIGITLEVLNWQRSSKHGRYCGLLHVRKEMAIAPTHLFGGVSHEFIDEPLVDGMRCEIAEKRMPRAVTRNAGDDFCFS
jgi:hypothetical protein